MTACQICLWYDSVTFTQNPYYCSKCNIILCKNHVEGFCHGCGKIFCWPCSWSLEYALSAKYCPDCIDSAKTQTYTFPYPEPCKGCFTWPHDMDRCKNYKHS